MTKIGKWRRQAKGDLREQFEGIRSFPTVCLSGNWLRSQVLRAQNQFPFNANSAQQCVEMTESKESPDSNKGIPIIKGNLGSLLLKPTREFKGKRLNP